GNNLDLEANQGSRTQPIETDRLHFLDVGRSNALNLKRYCVPSTQMIVTDPSHFVNEILVDTLNLQLNQRAQSQVRVQRHHRLDIFPGDALDFQSYKVSDGKL